MNSSLQNKIYLFGDSFIHGSGGDVTSDGRLKGIGYYLEKENIEVHDYSVQGSSNQSTFDYLDSTISNSEDDMCVVVGITSFLRDNLPYINVPTQWSRNHVDKKIEGDHPTIPIDETDEMLKDYIAFGYNKEYYQTLNDLFLIKINNIFCNLDNVTDYLFVYTVEDYKIPSCIDESKFLYKESLVDKFEKLNDESYFEHVSLDDPYFSGKTHLSSKGYEVVTKDIHDIFYNT